MVRGYAPLTEKERAELLDRVRGVEPTMSIDLTKPIAVRFQECDGLETDNHFYFKDDSVLYDGYPEKDGPAYAQLFEEAPRTKLEHGKMLALLKELIDNPGSDDVLYCLCRSEDDPGICVSHGIIAPLIAEIEGHSVGDKTSPVDGGSTE